MVQNNVCIGLVNDGSRSSASHRYDEFRINISLKFSTFRCTVFEWGLSVTVVFRATTVHAMEYIHVYKMVG